MPDKDGLFGLFPGGGDDLFDLLILDEILSGTGKGKGGKSLLDGLLEDKDKDEKEDEEDDDAS